MLPQAGAEAFGFVGCADPASGWAMALRAPLVLLVRAAEGCTRSFVLEDAAKHQNQEPPGLALPWALGAWVGVVPAGCAWRGACSCWRCCARFRVLGSLLVALSGWKKALLGALGTDSEGLALRSPRDC